MLPRPPVYLHNINFTEEKEPILSGAIGVRAHGVSARFDIIVVLPVDMLP